MKQDIIVLNRLFAKLNNKLETTKKLEVDVNNEFKIVAIKREAYNRVINSVDHRLKRLVAFFETENEPNNEICIYLKSSITRELSLLQLADNLILSNVPFKRKLV